MVCLKQPYSTLPNMKEADVLYCELHRVYVNMFIDAYILKKITQIYVEGYFHLHKCVK